MIIKIDLDKLKGLVEEAGNIVFTKESEGALLELLDLQLQLENAITEAKTNIEAAALELNPSFKSVIGEQVKVAYRAYGTRYKIDESYLDKLPKDLYTTRTRYYPKSDEIDRYSDEKGGLPLGVITLDRPKQISFKRKVGDEV